MDLDLSAWTERLAEQKREAEEAVSRLVSFIGQLEATLATAKEALRGVVAAAGGVAAPALSVPVVVSSAPALRPKQAPAAGFPPAVWARVEEIERDGAGELLAADAEALGLADHGGLADELMMRGWTARASGDAMLYDRAQAQAIRASLGLRTKEVAP